MPKGMWWVTGHLGSSWDIGSFKNKKEMNHPNSLLLPSPVRGGAALGREQEQEG